MASTDITRFLHRPNQRYVGTRLQQGRTILDSDWNEDALLTAEDRRAALVELVGCHGSTNAGFQISKVVQPTSAATTGYDFEIAPGSFFLGGMRFCLEQSERYLEQSDWIRVDERPELMPVPPTVAELLALPGQVRYDLVYLHAWQQSVTAVEDHELRERALGGPDSSTRVRRMRRVEIAPDVGTDIPADAFTAMFAKLEDAGLAEYDPTTAELVSKARLTVGVIADPSPSACGPNVPVGYVGYEDQTIRVELFGESHFCWGFCNAAPLYRVRVSKNDPTRVRFISQPRDGERAPEVGQIVELLPWSAKLPNDEKVAELQGVLARVTSGYDSKSREIVLDAEIPPEWLRWFETHEQHQSERDPDVNKRYLYLRVWDRGADTESPALIPFRPGTAVPLAGTGLQVTFESIGQSGDHWIVAARKATPTAPILSSAAPHGTRHFYAPLASIRWSLGPAGTEEVVATVRDARRRIRRLGERGCCTISVGDGTTSHGLVNDFGVAVAELPPEGGRIRLLPGTHDLNGIGEISGRNNIEIVGCGPQSVVTNSTAVTPTTAISTHGDPIITLTGCTEMRLRNLAVLADARVGIKVDDMCERVWLTELQFTQTGTYNDLVTDTFALSQPAIMVLGARELTIERCKVEVEDEISYTPALVLGGEKLRLLDSRIFAGPAVHPAPIELIKPMGGVHVLSQSSDVEIAGNVIRGGWGYGIAIGHVLEVNTAPLPPGPLDMATIWSAAERGLGEIVVAQLAWQPHASMPAVSLQADHQWQPCGAVTRSRIHCNEIHNMGLSGISTAAWGLLDASGRPIFLVVVDCDIARNFIHDNARVNADITASFVENADGVYRFCLGGVCLDGAINPHIRENQIVRNYLRDTVEPPDDDLPNVGIGVVAGQNVIVEDNRIIDNGVYSIRGIWAGLRGGIAVEEVLPVVGYTFNDSVDPSIQPPQPAVIQSSRESALTVRKNEVSQPSGKALWVRRAFGPVNVTDNVLQSFGDAAIGVAIDDASFCLENIVDMTQLTQDAQGACVEILALAASREHDFGATPASKLVDADGNTSTIGGPVQFCGNTTLLDWTIMGGHAASVLISSLDCAIVNDNVMVASMHNPVTLTGLTWITDPNEGLLAHPELNSFVLYHCYVGATGTVQVKGNRFEEGLSDAPYSLVTAGAITPATIGSDLELQHANVVVYNVGTHCIAGFNAINNAATVNNNVVVSSETCGSENEIFSADTVSVNVCLEISLTAGA